MFPLDTNTASGALITPNKQNDPAVPKGTHAYQLWAEDINPILDAVYNFPSVYAPFKAREDRRALDAVYASELGFRCDYDRGTNNYLVATNNRTAFLAACALAATFTPRKRVVLPPGQALIRVGPTDQINLPTGMRIEGDGTEITLGSEGSGDPLICINSSPGIVFTGPTPNVLSDVTLYGQPRPENPPNGVVVGAPGTTTDGTTTYHFPYGIQHTDGPGMMTCIRVKTRWFATAVSMNGEASFFDFDCDWSGYGGATLISKVGDGFVGNSEVHGTQSRVERESLTPYAYGHDSTILGHGWYIDADVSYRFLNMRWRGAKEQYQCHHFGGARAINGPQFAEHINSDWDGLGVPMLTSTLITTHVTGGRAKLAGSGFEIGAGGCYVDGLKVRGTAGQAFYFGVSTGRMMRGIHLDVDVDSAASMFYLVHANSGVIEITDSVLKNSTGYLIRNEAAGSATFRGRNCEVWCNATDLSLWYGGELTLIDVYNATNSTVAVNAENGPIALTVKRMNGGAIQVFNPSGANITTLDGGDNVLISDPIILAPVAKVRGYMKFRRRQSTVDLVPAGANPAKAISPTTLYDVFPVDGGAPVTIDRIGMGFGAAESGRAMGGPVWFVMKQTHAFSAADNLRPKTTAARAVGERVGWERDTVNDLWWEI